MQTIDQYTKFVELAPGVIVSAWVQFNRLFYVSGMVPFNFCQQHYCTAQMTKLMIKAQTVEVVICKSSQRILVITLYLAVICLSGQSPIRTQHSPLGSLYKSLHFGCHNGLWYWR